MLFSNWKVTLHYLQAFSWGFGGYGRLGHSETGNELVPRLIKFLDGPRRGIKSVVAGGQFNVALSEIPGTAYMWGQVRQPKKAVRLFTVLTFNPNFSADD